MIIRPATTADVSWIVGQLKDFAEFFGTTRSLFPDIGYAHEQVERLVRDQPTTLFLVAADHDVRLGFIVGQYTPHWMNPAILVLNELFWWVVPKARGSTIGARLLAEYIAAGKQHADWITMTLEAQSPVDPRSLERLGFHCHERNFLLEVHHG